MKGSSRSSSTARRICRHAAAGICNKISCLHVYTPQTEACFWQHNRKLPVLLFSHHILILLLLLLLLMLLPLLQQQQFLLFMLLLLLLLLLLQGVAGAKYA